MRQPPALIIEDDPWVGSLLELLLESRGWRPRVRRDGSSGLECAEAEAPQLAVVDLVLPDLDGLDVCRRLRALVPKITIVGISGVLSESKVRREADEREMDAFVAKPLALDELLPALRRPDSTGAETSPEADPLASQLAAIRDGFVRDVPGRVQVIADLWDRTLEQGFDAQVASALHLAVHSLTGTSGSVGLRVLSDHARRIEEVAEAVEGDERMPSTEERHCVRTLLRLIQESYAEDALAGKARPAEAGRAEAAAAGAEEEPPEAEERPVVLIVGDTVDDDGSLRSHVGGFGYRIGYTSSPAVLERLGGEVTLAALAADMMELEASPAMQRSIHELRARTGVPLLVLVRRDGFEERLRAVRQGASSVLVHPVDALTFAATLGDLRQGSTGPTRVLCVDDDPVHAERVRAILEGDGLEVEIQTDPRQAWESLVARPADIVLVDLYMPGCTGVELAKMIRQRDALLPVPVLYLSAEECPDKQLAARGEAGEGFVTKTADPERLVQEVRLAVRRSREVRTQMERDGLTGLLNHARLRERLDLEVKRALRDGGRFAFAMIDVDSFKAVNDLHGHLMGDRVLATLSSVIARRVRTTDLVGRWGGEEIAVVLLGVGADAGARIVDTVRRAIADLSFSTVHGSLRVTFSAGVAEFPGYQDTAALVQAADQALYRAKRRGKNRVEVARVSDREGEGAR